MKTYFQNLILTFVFSILIINLLSCSKQEKKHPVYLNADFKKYFDYQIGSYWVFYDSLNNNTDSLYVYENDYHEPYSSSNDNYEKIYIFIKNINNTEEIFIALNAPYSTELQTGNYNGGSINYPPFTNNIPFDTGEILYNSGDYSIYQNTFLPTFKINTTIYYNVYSIKNFYSAPSFLDVFYINADNGFIEILFNNKYFKQNLYLIKSNIIK